MSNLAVVTIEDETTVFVIRPENSVFLRRKSPPFEVMILPEKSNSPLIYTSKQ
jgi:hypothetical protein